MSGDRAPRFRVYTHTQPSWIPVGWAAWCEQCLSVLTEELLSLPPGPEHVLSDLREVEISLVDDATIARVHAEFLHDPSSTDVITFPYGEILVSCDTAARYASAHAIPPLQELFRYIVHGLSHLHGYLDSTPEQRAELFAVQEPLVLRYWNKCPSKEELKGEHRAGRKKRANKVPGGSGGKESDRRGREGKPSTK